jgi:hypothetical protein
MTVLLAAAALLAPVPAIETRHRGCNTRACDHRMTRKAHAKTVRRWRRATAPYQGWLASTRACESGSSGGYRLATTGNGFWFAYQHTPRSWYAAGGRSRNGRPAGVRSLQPEPAEQDFRAVVTLRQQGAAAWPICGR